MVYFFTDDNPMKIIAVGSDTTLEPKSSSDALHSVVAVRDAWESFLPAANEDSSPVRKCRALIEDQIVRACFFISAIRAIDRPFGIISKQHELVKFINQQLRDQSKIWVDFNSKDSALFIDALKRGDDASAQTSLEMLYRNWERRVERAGLMDNSKRTQAPDISVLSDVALEITRDNWRLGQEIRECDQREAARAELLNRQEAQIVSLRSEVSRVAENISSYKAKVQGEIDSAEKRAADVNQAFEEIKNNFHIHLLEVSSSNIGWEKKANENTATLLELEGKLKTFKEETEKAINEHTKAIGDRLKLRAASDYWNSKENNHSKRAYQGFAAFASLIISIFILAYIFSENLFLALDKIYSYQSGSLVNIVGLVAVSIPAALLFWVLRHVSRFMIEHFTSASDAAHRTAVIRTWIGLTVEDEGSRASGNQATLSTEERKIVLSEMFRPPATDSRADSNTIPIIEILQKVVDPKQKKD